MFVVETGEGACPKNGHGMLVKVRIGWLYDSVRRDLGS